MLQARRSSSRSRRTRPWRARRSPSTSGARAGCSTCAASGRAGRPAPGRAGGLSADLRRVRGDRVGLDGHRQDLRRPRRRWCRASRAAAIAVERLLLGGLGCSSPTRRPWICTRRPANRVSTIAIGRTSVMPIRSPGSPRRTVSQRGGGAAGAAGRRAAGRGTAARGRERGGPRGQSREPRRGSRSGRRRAYPGPSAVACRRRSRARDGRVGGWSPVRRRAIARGDGPGVARRVGPAPRAGRRPARGGRGRAPAGRRGRAHVSRAPPVRGVPVSVDCTGSGSPASVCTLPVLRLKNRSSPGSPHAELLRLLLDHLRRLRLGHLFLQRLALPGERVDGLLQLRDPEGALGQRGADQQRADQRPAEQHAQQQDERHPVAAARRAAGGAGSTSGC